MKYLLTLVIIAILFSCSATDIKSPKTIKGMFSYMDDAGILVDCVDDNKYAIAMEADYISLEKAYFEVVENSSDKILITLRGYIEKRKHIDSEKEMDYLIVDKFDRIWPNIDCTRNLGTAYLTNTFWSLREFNGIMSKEFNKIKDIHFIINQNNEIKGFSGCNNFLGNTLIINDSLKIGILDKTLVSCKTLKIETDFLKMIKRVNHFKIYGEYLYLYENNNLLSKFESVYFN